MWLEKPCPANLAPLLPVQSHWPASATHGGKRGEGRGPQWRGPLPQHTWTQPCRRLSEAPAVGETGTVGVKEQPARSPHTKAAPLRIWSPPPGPACQSWLPAALLRGRGPHARPIRKSLCAVFWTKLSQALSQSTGHYRDGLDTRGDPRTSEPSAQRAALSAFLLRSPTSRGPQPSGLPGSSPAARVLRGPTAQEA